MVSGSPTMGTHDASSDHLPQRRQNASARANPRPSPLIARPPAAAILPIPQFTHDPATFATLATIRSTTYGAVGVIDSDTSNASDVPGRIVAEVKAESASAPSAGRYSGRLMIPGSTRAYAPRRLPQAKQKGRHRCRPFAIRTGGSGSRLPRSPCRPCRPCRRRPASPASASPSSGPRRSSPRW